MDQKDESIGKDESIAGTAKDADGAAPVPRSSDGKLREAELGGIVGGSGGFPGTGGNGGNGGNGGSGGGGFP